MINYLMETYGSLLTCCYLLEVLNMASATTMYASLGRDMSIACPEKNVNTWLKLDTSEFLALCENGLQHINGNLSISSRLSITNDCNVLRINNFSKEDTGVYVCYIVSKKTGRHKYEVNIKIRSISIVEANNSSVIKRMEGERITLTCIVFGAQLGEILYWTTEDIMVASNDTNYVTYTFTAQRTDNMAEFICRSNSSFGSNLLAATVKLNLITRPATPRNIQYVALYNEIIVKWQAGYSDLQQQTFLVQYHHRFQSTWSTVHSENTTSVAISGLEQDMVYFVRMLARTIAGDSNTTEEIIVKTGKRPTQCYSLELAVLFVGIILVILLCWCWRKGSNQTPCRPRNQCRILNQSIENDTTQNRPGAHYDEIEGIQIEIESGNISPEVHVIRTEQVQPVIPSNNNTDLDDTNSSFVLDIYGESDKSQRVIGLGITENRNYSLTGRRSSGESHIVKYIDSEVIDERLNENRNELAAERIDSPTSSLSQNSETDIKSIRKYETLEQTNTVEHCYELIVVDS